MGKVIVVGGGIAGLTAAAYLSKQKIQVTLIEKNDTLGGLIGGFVRDGIYYDSGIRAIEDSGTVTPMLRQLGLQLSWMNNHVSIGIEGEMIRLDHGDAIEDYASMLICLFPEQEHAIRLIENDIRLITDYMDVLYGIDNPLFMDRKENPEYYKQELMPWLLRYIRTVGKIEKLKTPVNDYLAQYTTDRSLIDMITQHFFDDTPVSFALSYLRMYTDYHYPLGGTVALPQAMEAMLRSLNGEILTDCRIVHADLENRILEDQNGNRYHYDQLIWAADMSTFYQVSAPPNCSKRCLATYQSQKQSVEQSKGNNSIFAVYTEIESEFAYFRERGGEHVFYTAVKDGLHHLEQRKKELFLIDDSILFSQKMDDYLKEFAKLTTYEISIPSLRDESLCDNGRFSLVISTLFDYKLSAKAKEMDQYQELKDILRLAVLNVLDQSIYPDLNSKVKQSFCSTPHTYENRFLNKNGAITGWAFGHEIPAEDRFLKIRKSVETPFEHVWQAGQWTFSPSGFPTSIITGKMAADRVMKYNKL